MNTELSKPRNNILSDILKIIVIDTLWVVLVIGFTGFIRTLLPDNTNARDVNSIGYLFGALLIGIIIGMKIRPGLLPIGGFYMSVFVLKMRSLLPSNFLEVWGLSNQNGEFLDLSANAWMVMFCINSILSQLFGVGTAQLYRRMQNSIKFHWMNNGVWLPNGIGYKCLKILIGQFIWLVVVSSMVVGPLLLYTAIFTHAPLWLPLVVFTATISIVLFPLILNSWVEFAISIPITVLLSLIIAFMSPLDEVLGMVSIFKWMYYDFSPAINAIINIGITLALEFFSLSVWRWYGQIFQKKSNSV